MKQSELARLDYRFTHRLTRDEYIESQSFLKKKVRSRAVLVIAAVGIAFLFWEYTFLIGIGLLLLFTVIVVAPGILHVGAGSQYSSSKYLQYTLTCAFTKSGISVKGENGLTASCSWNNHIQWVEDRDWITVSGAGMPGIYIPVDDLKRSGMYELLISYLERHGEKFRVPDKPSRKHKLFSRNA
jgi:hypothetical protein